MPNFLGNLYKAIMPFYQCDKSPDIIKILVAEANMNAIGFQVVHFSFICFFSTHCQVGSVNYFLDLGLF